MLDFFVSLDNKIFYLIVDTLKNNFFDWIMPLISDAKLWRVPLLILWIMFILLGKNKGLKIALLIIPTIIISDFICGGVLQPLFQRQRPLGGTTFSFPSCHASNMFSAALIISIIWQNKLVTIISYFIAFLVGYSRIYTTSHYPSDVFFGAMIGTLIALFVVYMWDKILSQKIKFNKKVNIFLL